MSVPDAFAVMVMNHIELGDAEITWYSPSASCQICLYSFRLTWPCNLSVNSCVLLQYFEQLCLHLSHKSF